MIQTFSLRYFAYTIVLKYFQIISTKKIVYLNIFQENFN